MTIPRFRASASATATDLRPVRPIGANTSSGSIWFWQGGSLWIGRGEGRTQWHAHHAHQLALAPDGCFRFRAGADGTWTSYEAAFVPSHCTHQFELEQGAMAHLFVEPETRAGRALSARYGRDGVAALPSDDGRPAARRLFDALRATPEPAAMAAAARAALATLVGTDTETDADLDPRLARALEHIRRHVRSPLALGDVAAAVALSESRFRHLFVAATGSSFRAYLLWLRINLAIEAVMAGASWTEAAHAAGFADSAHLTRTHKRMFGIEPSALRPQPPGRPAA